MKLGGYVGLTLAFEITVSKVKVIRGQGHF